jgi:hypothetical protein
MDPNIAAEEIRQLIRERTHEIWLKARRMASIRGALADCSKQGFGGDSDPWQRGRLIPLLMSPARNI